MHSFSIMTRKGDGEERMQILEQEPRLHDVLLFVSSKREFDC
jgi:hypothetical protein